MVYCCETMAVSDGNCAIDILCRVWQPDPFVNPNSSIVTATLCITVTLYTGKSQVHFAVYRPSKSIFFCATNISVGKFCPNKMGQKPTKLHKKEWQIVHFSIQKPKSCAISDQFCAPFRSSGCVLCPDMWLC